MKTGAPVVVPPSRRPLAVFALLVGLAGAAFAGYSYLSGAPGAPRPQDATP